MVDALTVRKLWRRLEPCHAFIYFAPEAGLRYADLGLAPEAGYFASRSAAMGAVGPEVVIATFFNFKPELVHRALPSAWDVAAPGIVLDARMAAADEALRRMLGDDVEHPDLVTAAALARRAAEACTPSGRPIYAAHAGLPWPDAPHLQLFHAVTLLREFRGDAHVAALTLEGYDAVEALVTHLASGEVALPGSLLQATRGWDDDEWEAGHDRLKAKGLLTDDLALTDAGTASRQRVEDLTDQGSIAPWSVLTDDEAEQLRTLVAPFSRSIAGQMFGG